MAILAFACGGDDERLAATITPEVEPTRSQSVSTPQASPSPPAPTATPFVLPPDYIRIPAVGVAAPLFVAEVGRDGQLPDNETPDDVLWYDLSAWPSLGGTPGQGNLILAGKLDTSILRCFGGQFGPGCTGVFWNLRNLLPGDEVHLSWAGEKLLYTVTLVCNTETRNFEHVVAKSEAPILTLITSAGRFTTGAGYSHYTIVIAELQQLSTSPSCPEEAHEGNPVGPRDLRLRYEGTTDNSNTHRFTVHEVSLPSTAVLTISPKPASSPSGRIEEFSQHEEMLTITLPDDAIPGFYLFTVLGLGLATTSLWFEHVP